MRRHRHTKTLAGLLAVLLAGCGEPDGNAVDNTDPAPAEPEARPGEVVVEPSAAAYAVDGQPSDTLGHVRALLADERVAKPAGYHVEIDNAFDQPARVRFWLTPDGDAEPEAVDQAATAVYDALADVFARDMQAAVQREIARLDAELEATAGMASKAQEAYRSFRESMRGVPETDATRLESARLDHAITSILERQVELDEQIESLQRNLDRKRYPTLYRIR